MKNFQIILLIVFGVLAVLAVAFFSGGISLPSRASDSPTGGATGRVVMWGTIPRSQLAETLEFFNSQLGGGLTLSYIYKSPDIYEKELLDSFAFGGTPDIILFPNNLINVFGDRVVMIPYQGFSDRMFSDAYIQAAEVFKTEAGMFGFPIFSDPLVMFYNRDHFDAKGVAMPPAYWKDLAVIVPELTETNQLLEIQRSGVAFGESKNVRNFKKILLAMNIQLGNPVVARDSQKGIYIPVLSQKSYISAKPAEESLKFFLEFSNPLKAAYSWNKSMPDSLMAFVGGDLSIYFGLASEAALIQRMNPNLDFDIAPIPQVEGSGSVLTYADVYAVAIPKNAANFQGAFYVASQMANGPLASAFSLVSGLAPVRRDFLAETNSFTKFTDVSYKAALQSRSWVDPNDAESNRVFSDMVENVLSGLKDYQGSVSEADKELEIILAQ